MGEAADRKVKEIEQARARVEDDLRELEARLPDPVRSAKAVAGAIAGSSLVAGSVWLMRRRKKRNSHKERASRVVVRVVHEGPGSSAAAKEGHLEGS